MRLLKSYLLTLGLVLLTLGAWAQNLAGTTYRQAQTAKRGTIAFTFIETPGFAARNAAGELEGICIDLLNGFVNYVQAEKGINLTIKYAGKDPNNFDTFLDEVKTGNGGVIGLGNITITEARKRQYTFTPAYINNVSITITHKDVNTLTDLGQISRQFSGMKAYAVRGTTNQATIERIKAQHWPDLEIVLMDSSPEVLEQVLRDKNSFSNLDFTYYLSALQSGKPLKRHPAGDESSEEFGLIMPLNSDWSPVWQEYLTMQFRTSSSYRKIIAEHLGASALKLLDTMNGQ